MHAVSELQDISRQLNGHAHPSSTSKIANGLTATTTDEAADASLLKCIRVDATSLDEVRSLSGSGGHVDMLPAVATMSANDSTLEASVLEIEGWVRDYWRAWNDHSAVEVTAALDPHVVERSWDKNICGAVAVGKANKIVFDAKPNMKIEVLYVHAAPFGNRAMVEVTVNVNDESTKSFNVTEVMEFTDTGKISSLQGSLAAITDRWPTMVDGGDDPRHLRIEGLPANGDDLYLYKIFSPFGAIQHVQTRTNEDGTCQGTGFVTFLYASEAKEAFSLVDGEAVEDGVSSNKVVQLHVSISKSKDDKKVTE